MLFGVLYVLINDPNSFYASGTRSSFRVVKNFKGTSYTFSCNKAKGANSVKIVAKGDGFKKQFSPFLFKRFIFNKLVSIQNQYERKMQESLFN